MKGKKELKHLFPKSIGKSEFIIKEPLLILVDDLIVNKNEILYMEKLDESSVAIEFKNGFFKIVDFKDKVKRDAFFIKDIKIEINEEINNERI